MAKKQVTLDSILIDAGNLVTKKVNKIFARELKAHSKDMAQMEREINAVVRRAERAEAKVEKLASSAEDLKRRLEELRAKKGTKLKAPPTKQPRVKKEARAKVTRARRKAAAPVETTETIEEATATFKVIPGMTATTPTTEIQQ